MLTLHQPRRPTKPPNQAQEGKHVTFDLSNVEKSEFELIPEGEYAVRVTGAKAYTAQTGNQGANLDLVITDGPYERRRLWDTIWYSALGRMAHAADAFGAPMVNFDPLTSLNGLEAIAVVRHEVYNGKTREKIRAYAPLPADKRDPLAPAGNKASSDEDIPF